MPQISNVITQGLSYFPVSLYIATFASLLFDPLTATIVLALFNLSAVIGTVVLGTLSDRFPYAVIMTVSELGAALGALFLWGFAKSPVSLYFFAIIFGALVSDTVTVLVPSYSHAYAERRIHIYLAQRRGRVRSRKP